MRSLVTTAALIALASASLAQVDRKIWIPTDAAVHEIDQAGNLLVSYPGSCFSVGNCSNRVARDGLGNVYIGQLGTLAPGITGWVKAYRSGVGEIAVVPEPTTDLVCDAGNLVWRLRQRFDASTQRSSTDLVRSSPGLAAHASLPLGAVAASLSAHSGGGVWLAMSQLPNAAELRRVPPSLVLGQPLALPGRILAMASDHLPRVWLADEFGYLHRASDGGTGAPVLDWSLPFGGNAASLHVDLCGTVHVHVPGASSSTILRFTADGVALPSIVLPRTTALSLGTGGGYAYLRSSGLNLELVQVDAVGSRATPVGSAFSGGVVRGDLTGAAWCASASPLLDSDGDGFDNTEETRRGADLFDAASVPPTLHSIPIGSSLPATWLLVYSDLEPDHRGLIYQLVLSASATTGFSVPARGLCPIVPIDLDGLLLASLQPSPLWSGFGGTLDAQGQGLGTLRFPPGLPPGLPLYLAGVTLSPTSGALVTTTAALAVRTP